MQHPDRPDHLVSGIHSRGVLPHLKREGGTYFVTFRLAGTLPKDVHVVVRPSPPHVLSDILHSWKSFTSHKISELLPEKVVPFWQSDSYDHLIRDDDDLQRMCYYTIVNPVSARLCARPEDWPWSSAHQGTGGSSHVGPGGGTPPEPAGENACAT